MRISKLCVFGFGFVASLATLFVLNSHAYAATKTWTGDGGDTNMNTAGNWGGSAPSADDDLVFPADVTNRTVVNNYTAGTSFNSITFSGTDTSGSEYTISGNAMVLVAGVSASTGGSGSTFHTISAPLTLNTDQTITTATNNYLTLSGIISGTGNLIKAGDGYLSLGGANTFSGSMTINAGTVVAKTPTALGAAAGATTNNASLQIRLSSDDKVATVTEPFTFNTSSAIVIDAVCGFGACIDGDITLSGAIVLGADTEIITSAKVTLTGALSGAHTIKLSSSAAGVLVINASSNTSSTPNGNSGAGVAATTTYAENKPAQNISVNDKNTAIVTGTYGDVMVVSGGILKGSGKVGVLSISAGGTVAPGLSPGCLSSGNLLLNGTYEFEIGGAAECTGYDQIKVTGTVVLSDTNGAGILSIVLPKGIELKKDQVFKIIDNDGSDAVTGTFKDLAEGATVNVNGSVFKVTYKGGDGNDVVLTVVTVGAPNTGFRLGLNSPFMTFVIPTTAALGILVLAKKSRQTA